jgi:hypothetical protein
MTSHADRPGCLAAMFSLFRPAPKQSPADPTQAAEPLVPSAMEPVLSAPGPLHYRVRDDFLSAAELSFYHVLRILVGDNAVVQSKVGLADIFFVSRPNENQAARPHRPRARGFPALPSKDLGAHGRHRAR